MDRYRRTYTPEATAEQSTDKVLAKNVDWPLGKWEYAETQALGGTYSGYVRFVEEAGIGGKLQVNIALVPTDGSTNQGATEFVTSNVVQLDPNETWDWEYTYTVPEDTEPGEYFFRVNVLEPGENRVHVQTQVTIEDTPGAFNPNSVTLARVEGGTATPGEMLELDAGIANANPKDASMTIIWELGGEAIGRKDNATVPAQGSEEYVLKYPASDAPTGETEFCARLENIRAASGQ